MPARVFGQCSVCTHASMVRAGAACGLCGGAVERTPAPPDLLDGWRCPCYQCAATPC